MYAPASLHFRQQRTSWNNIRYYCNCPVGTRAPWSVSPGQWRWLMAMVRVHSARQTVIVVKGHWVGRMICTLVITKTSLHNGRVSNIAHDQPCSSGDSQLLAQAISLGRSRCERQSIHALQRLHSAIRVPRGIPSAVTTTTHALMSVMHTTLQEPSAYVPSRLRVSPRITVHLLQSTQERRSSGLSEIGPSQSTILQ